MATHAARVNRNHEVRKRLDAAFSRISDQLGVPVPPEPKRTRDPDLQPIVELERFADFAESVLAALPSNASVDAAGAARGVDLDAALLAAADAYDEQYKQRSPIDREALSDYFAVAVLEQTQPDEEDDDASDEGK